LVPQNLLGNRLRHVSLSPLVYGNLNRTLTNSSVHEYQMQIPYYEVSYVELYQKLTENQYRQNLTVHDHLKLEIFWTGREE
jgi:hypothetical protein